MSREQEAIERMEKADFQRPHGICKYDRMLAALLAPSPCPTCGGTGSMLSGGIYSVSGCPDCTDGTVPPLLVWNEDK